MYDDALIFPLISGEPNVNYQNIYICGLQRAKKTANLVISLLLQGEE
jgi:hypothetical protein